MNLEKWLLVGLVAVVFWGWYVMLPASQQGYGYTGYRGNYRIPGGGFFYQGGNATTFPTGDGSVRTGSVRGPSTGGRGLHGGK